MPARHTSHSIRIVCFDIGGVLVRHCRSWAEGCEAAGLPLRPGADAPDLVQKRRRLSHHFTCGEISEPEFFHQMAETTGRLYTPDEIERIHHAWLGDEYDGIAGILERLIAAEQVDTGILSNTNTLHWTRLMENGGGYVAPRLPRHRHASHLLGMAKPSEDIYHEFAARSGYRPGEILFFDDLPDNIAAAQAAGWQTVLIDHKGDPAAQVRAELEQRELL
jgi:glucose-1-phosphatase